MINTPDPDNRNQELERGPFQSRERVGQLLRAARTSRGLSVQDVARRLRLSVRQITALEEDDYSKLASNNTFLRGFVRNYAKVVEIDALPLLRLLEQLLPPDPAPTIIPQTEGIPFPSNRKQGVRSFLIVSGAILALALLIYEIYRGNEATMDGQKPASKTESQAGAAPEVTESLPLPTPLSMPPRNDGNEGKTESLSGDRGAIEQKSIILPPGSDSAPISGPVPVPVAGPVQQIAPAAGVQNEGDGSVQGGNVQQRPPAGDAPEVIREWKDTLHFVFGGESWTEVKDGRGRLLLSRVNPPGTEQFLRGEPPFSLAIGNAATVRLFYNGKLVDLSPYINRYGGTARLLLQ